MTLFIGRVRELEELERRYSQKRSGTCAVYGRRRVGKTAMLREFCKDKPNLFLLAVEGSSSATMKSYWRSMSSFSGRDVDPPSDMYDVVDFLKGIKADGKIVVVMDELPYLTDAMPESMSILQHFIDLDLPGLDMFLIVCGSSIGAMMEMVGDSDKPLFGRFIGPMRVEPLPYWECRSFHPHLSEEDCMRIYCIAGGVPLYHILMQGDTVEDCIKGAFLGPYSPLREEAMNVIARELVPREPNMRVLESMASGSTRLKEISERSGLFESSCKKYLDRLIVLGIVEKVVPMGGAKGRVALYRITDGLMRFHFKVLIETTSSVEYGDPDVSYSMVRNLIDEFYGPGFECICRDWVSRNHRCRGIGSWWGTVDGEDVDVDIVALASDGVNEYALVGESKFGNKLFGIREYNILTRRVAAMKGLMNVRYVLFSRSGFTEDMYDLEERGNIRLLTPADMYG